MAKPEPMPARQVLSLAAMALEHVAEQSPDVSDWGRAAGELRQWLAKTRGPVGDWTWYSDIAHRGVTRQKAR
jgi:hypothetical protein